MREIKFRAWHREKKCWLDSVHIYGDGSWSGTLVEERGEIDGYDERECELSQYTGLKDKNGKEIYEGDIVISMDTGNHPAVIECDAPNGGYNIRGGNGDYIDISSNTRMKVIGNIYQNPGLLTPAKV